MHYSFFGAKFGTGLACLLLLTAFGLTKPVHAQVSGQSLRRESNEQERETYERLGLSMEEWKKIKESGMEMKKVHRLLRAGISISEYFNEPWKHMGISEKEWIKKRSQGYSDAQIAFKESRGKECDKQWDVVRAFFMPGIIQLKRKQHLKGSIMAATAGAGLLTGTSFLIYNSATGASLPVLPIFVVLLPVDMTWSGMDIILQQRYSANPDLKRFSGRSLHSKPYISLTVPITF